VGNGGGTNGFLAHQMTEGIGGHTTGGRFQVSMVVGVGGGATGGKSVTSTGEVEYNRGGAWGRYTFISRRDSKDGNRFGCH